MVRKYTFSDILPNILSRLSILILAVVVFLGCCGFDSSQQKVYDNANILNEDEEAKLQQMCVEYAQQAQIDIIILTDKNTSRKSSMTFTEDFYMANDFGYDKKHGDGVILMIDMHKREVWISTSGKAIDYLSDTRIDNLVTGVTGKLSSGSYYTACSNFITKTAAYMKSKPSPSDKGGNGNTTYVHDAASLTEKLLYALPIKLAISAALAMIVMMTLRSQSRAKMTIHGRQYMHNNQYTVRHQTDQFIRTTRVRHEKSSGSSGGGGGSHGGSSHRGSGGHSFGGGGGRF